MSDAINIVCPHCHAVNRVPSDKLSARPKCGKCKAHVLDGQPLDLTASTFQQHVGRSDFPVVVDFWASWCGPCKMMAPVFAQVAVQMNTEAQFAKVNTESEQGLANQYGIRSIPTLAIFRQGREIARQAGAMDANTLMRWIRAAT